ncbi:MAG: SDR family NAD(P)-dependent oxidoreductase [Euryarchaeota archaeon]|jgi:UDP-glucose 4-epimerase|nr:SDR family NAD(P)-dependent oxidoreductase [Euryarchaeota archaeon]
MRCIVTGGGGFLGSHLSEALLTRGHSVAVVDDLFRGRKANMEDFKSMPDFTFVLGDCANVEKLEKAEEKLHGVDVVFHLAAINGTKYFDERADLVIDVNLKTTETVVKFATDRGARLVFTSSPEAFGLQTEMPLKPDAGTIFPSPHEYLRHSYGASKYLGEMLVHYAVRERGLDGRIVRPFNGYGPRLKGDEHGQVTSIFLHQCLAEKDITLHGDGTQTRCFTWYNDLIDGFIALGELDEGLDGSNLSGASFNIGSTEEVTIRRIAEIALEVSGSEGKIVSTKGHPGDSSRRLPDISAAEAALGWAPTIGIEEGMMRCWDWFQLE